MSWWGSFEVKEFIYCSSAYHVLTMFWPCLTWVCRPENSLGKAGGQGCFLKGWTGTRRDRTNYWSACSAAHQRIRCELWVVSWNLLTFCHCMLLVYIYINLHTQFIQSTACRLLYICRVHIMQQGNGWNGWHPYITIDHSSKARWKDLAGWTIVAIQESRLLVRSYCSPSSVFKGTEQDKQGSGTNSERNYSMPGWATGLLDLSLTI